MIKKSMIFGFVFTAIDLAVYFLIYFLVAVILKRFMFYAAMNDAAGAVLGRLVYFQVFVEIFLLFLVRSFSFQKQIFAALIVNLVAFILPLMILLRRITIIPNFFPIYLHSGDLGPAWGLLASTLLTWLIMFKVTRISEWLD